ncbi:SIR2 family protein [Paraburkholderia phenoliruptrix]|nr:SIR2 family protein [Paraburkholderia phenoliruptrix]
MDDYSLNDTWKESSKVIDYLARRAVDNQLILVLGAGASMGCGLPSWGALVAAAHQFADEKMPEGADAAQAAENLASKLPGGAEEFAKLVGRALYSVKSLTTGAYEAFNENLLLENELLSAISALVMLSCRRGHGTVITYNFDDLLETYLAERGLFAYPHIEQPSWFLNEDVSILHPHGFASRRPDVFPSSKTITFTALDFDRQTGQQSNPWRAKLLGLLQSSTPLFIGLSGQDQNLRSVLADVQQTHVSLSAGHPFWGVRICTDNDAHISIWENRAVWCERVADFKEIPKLLMAICKRSAELMTKSKLGIK